MIEDGKSSKSSQDRVFDLLEAPSTHGGTEVRRIDTHAASVFLAGNTAYKIKRDVRFPFLDYSSLAKRQAACQSEIDVNKRFAPDLYRRVIPITQEPDGSLKLDGHGHPVEWVVEMARFDEDQTLDRLADKGSLDTPLCLKLAQNIAKMHELATAADGAAWLKALGRFVDQNTQALNEQNDLFDARSVQILDERSRSTLSRLTPILKRRVELHLVRRGHGDLHLGNIALVDGEPIAFDAIEFDPIIASGDVLYDLAFLLMDLIERGHVELSNVVMNEYFSKARRDADLDGIAALPFFMSVRAAIRAKVTAARFEKAEHADRPAIKTAALRYFRLACELMQPAQAAVICTGGLSGTGKSVLARSLAPNLLPLPGALILRSDVERKAMFNVPETQSLPPEAYEGDTSTRLYEVLCEKAGRIARSGHSVIVDAVFAKPAERAAIESAARAAGANFFGLFLTAPLDVRLKRIRGRLGDVSDADAAVARQQDSYELGKMNWTLLDASGSPVDTLATARELIPNGIKAPEPPLPSTRRSEDPPAPDLQPPVDTQSFR